MPLSNHRVQIFDSDGNYKRQFGTTGQFNNPQAASSTALQQSFRTHTATCV
jgi:hypothetical protein